jgi:hypothetical protein
MNRPNRLKAPKHPTELPQTKANQPEELSIEQLAILITQQEKKQQTLLASIAQLKHQFNITQNYSHHLRTILTTKKLIVASRFPITSQHPPSQNTQSTQHTPHSQHLPSQNSFQQHSLFPPSLPHLAQSCDSTAIPTAIPTATSTTNSIPTTNIPSVPSTTSIHTSSITNYPIFTPDYDPSDPFGTQMPPLALSPTSPSMKFGNNNSAGHMNDYFSLNGNGRERDRNYGLGDASPMFKSSAFAPLDSTPLFNSTAISTPNTARGKPSTTTHTSSSKVKKNFKNEQKNQSEIESDSDDDYEVIDAANIDFRTTLEHFNQPADYFRGFLISMKTLESQQPDFYKSIVAYKAQYGLASHRFYCRLCSKTIGTDQDSHVNYHWAFFQAKRANFNCEPCFFGFSNSLQLGRHRDRSKQCIYWAGSDGVHSTGGIIEDTLDEFTFQDQSKLVFDTNDYFPKESD